MNNPILKAIVIKTNEHIKVYSLSDGKYADADAISDYKEPTAKIANKKIFEKHELKFQ
jgi:hypothetical protein